MKLCLDPITMLMLGVSKCKVATHAKSLSCVQLCVTPCTIAHQASLSMGIFRQEYWSGLLCPPPGTLPDPGIKPVAPEFQVDSLLLSHHSCPKVAITSAKMTSMSCLPCLDYLCPPGIAGLPTVHTVNQTVSAFPGYPELF